MNFESYIFSIIKKINQNSYDTYVVGRCVAYKILEKPIEEYEIWTSTPLFSIPKFVKEKRYPNKIIIEDFSKKVTIYSGTSLEQFLKDYSFKFEQLAYHFHHGIIDKFNALEEIEKKRLSLNWNYKNISIFDALYISEYLQFSIEKDVERNINEASLICTKNCAKKLSKILLLNTPGKLMKKYSALPKALLDEYSNEILEMLDYLKVDLVLRLACLVINQEERGVELLMYWGFAQNIREEVRILLEWINYPLQEKNMDIFLDNLSQDLISYWFALKRAKCLLDFNKIKEIDRLDILENKVMESSKRRNDKFKK